MKRVSKILAVAIMTVLVVAGCTMKVDYGFEIGSDKKVALSITAAYDKEMIDGLSSMNGSTTTTDTTTTEAVEMTDEQRWAFVDESFKSFNDDDVTKKKYEAEGFYGYVYTSNNKKDISELATDSATEKVYINLNSDSEEDDGDLTSKKIFIKTGDNKYKSNIAVKGSESFAQYTSYGAMFDMTLSIKLPVKPISNNATKVSDDGMTLTWDLTKATDIDFEFEFDSSAATNTNGGVNTTGKKDAMKVSNTMIYVGVGGICLVLIIIAVVIIKSKGNKDAAANTAVEAPINPLEAPTTDAPVEPVVPTEPVAPAEPVVPVTPVEPAVPTEPVAPVVPETPVVPEEPVQPAEPVAPVVPEAPVQPTEPVQNDTNNQM